VCGRGIFLIHEEKNVGGFYYAVVDVTIRPKR